MYLARGGGGVVDPPVGSAPPALRRDGESISKGLIKVKVLGVSGSCRGPHLLWWVECPCTCCVGIILAISSTQRRVPLGCVLAC